MIWNPIDVVLELIKNGISGRANQTTGVAVCRAESGFNDQATLDNTKLNPPGKGIDRGLFQINSFWHPEVTDEMAFDGATNVREAVRIYRDNSSEWTPWSAFNNGAYKAHLEMARVAVEAAHRISDRDKAIADRDDMIAHQGAMISNRDAQIADLTAQLEAAGAELETLRGLKARFDAWVASILTGEQVSGTA